MLIAKNRSVRSILYLLLVSAAMAAMTCIAVKGIDILLGN
jgi:hypothetical protein